MIIDEHNTENLCYHCHNSLCDGEDIPKSYVLEAVNQNIKDIGFSSHSPLKFLNNYSISVNNLTKLMSEIEILQTKFNGKINIFKSIEADFIPFYTYSFKYLKQKWNLDYIIGSIHLVRNPANEKLFFIDGGIENFQKNLKTAFNGNIKKAVENYYLQSIEMIKSENPDIIAHLDKIIINSSKIGISENSAWYISLIDKLLMEIKNQNTIVEINTRAKYQAKWHDTNPGEKIIRKLISKNIPIIISTDAHKPAQLNLLYKETKNRLKNLGLKSQMRFVNNKWEEINI